MRSVPRTATSTVYASSSRTTRSCPVRTRRGEASRSYTNLVHDGSELPVNQASYERDAADDPSRFKKLREQPLETETTGNDAGRAQNQRELSQYLRRGLPFLKPRQYTACSIHHSNSVAFYARDQSQLLPIHRPATWLHTPTDGNTQA